MRRGVGVGVGVTVSADVKSARMSWGCSATTLTAAMKKQSRREPSSTSCAQGSPFGDIGVGVGVGVGVGLESGMGLG